MNLTGPLGKQYCLIFKFMSLFALFFSILAAIIIIYNLVTARKASESWMLLSAIPVYLLMYIQNRLLYNICLQ